MRRVIRPPLIVVAVLVLTTAGIAQASGWPPGRTFSDDDGNTFEPAIEAIAAEGITKGCNPPANDKFCPNDNVTRGEMAVFLVRAMGYTDSGGGDLFIDDDGLFYENSADKLGTAKVTVGCNPPVNNRYCGEAHVTRGQMAAFLVRAMGYSDNGGGNLFTDDDGHLFENAIDKLGTAGVTQGCNPPANDRFCPDDLVTRGQMATFLARALDLSWVLAADSPSCTNSEIHWCYGDGNVAEFSATLERPEGSTSWKAVETHPLITYAVDLKTDELVVDPGKNTTVASVTFTGGGTRSEVAPLLWSAYVGYIPIPEWADRIVINAHDAVPADFGMTIRVYDFTDGSRWVRVDNYEEPVRDMKVQHRWAYPDGTFNFAEWFPSRGDTGTRWFNVDSVKVWDFRAFYPIPSSSADWGGRTQLAEVVDP